MYPLNGRVRPLGPRAQVLLAQPLTARPDFRKLGSLGLWHGRLPASLWARRRTAPGRLTARPSPGYPGLAGTVRGDRPLWALHTGRHDDHRAGGVMRDLVADRAH